MFKRPGSNNWYYSYTENGKPCRKSTGTSNPKKASQIEANFRLGRVEENRVHGENWIKEFTQGGRKLRIFSQAKARSKKRGHDSTLSKPDFDKIIRRSNGFCEVTGVPFSDAKYSGSKRRPFSASIDRIDSGKGYSYENCRLVCLAVNFAMSEWGDEVINILAKGIVYKRLQHELL